MMWERIKKWGREHIMRRFHSWKLGRDIKKGIKNRGRTE